VEGRIILKWILQESVEWINTTQDRCHRWDFVNNEINIRVTGNAGIRFTDLVTTVISEEGRSFIQLQQNACLKPENISSRHIFIRITTYISFLQHNYNTFEVALNVLFLIYSTAHASSLCIWYHK
jgi:hypothetical protein